MEIIIYVLPFILALFLFVFFRSRTAWWEYAALIAPSILLALLVECGMKGSNTEDTEYLGYYVKKVSHYDRWNEYIHRTCTREVPCGTDKDGKTVYREEEYDCSYVEDHPERWTYTLNNDDEEYFYDRKEFDRAVAKLGAKPRFVDMHRDYYTLDGDRQDYCWTGDRNRMVTMTFPEKYENRVKSSHSVFKYEKVTDAEKNAYGLFDYPPIVGMDQNPVLGINPGSWAVDAVRQLNGMYGMSRQFRMFVLVFQGKPAAAAEMQRSYWQGANKNEFVVCVGLDSKTKRVQWCVPFSWQDKPVIEAKTRDWFLTRGCLDLRGYCRFIEPYVRTSWKRKSFKDFNYVDVDLSDAQVTWLFVIVLLFDLLACIWIVCNDFTAKKPGGGDATY